MRLRLRRKPDKPATGEGRPSIDIRRLSGKEEILSYLEPRRLYAATAFAHVETSFPQVSRWYLGTRDGHFALCLVARGLNPNYLFTMGDPQVLRAVIESASLPGRTCITCQPDQLPVIQEYYELEWQLVATRMVVDRENFSAAPEKATRLKPANAGDLNRLYMFERSGTFSASQIRRGVYYGIWQDEQLVAVAGTHLVASVYGIGYVGNVLTHPFYRNKGLAKICVSSVTAELLDHCNEVVLNVESHNLPAVRAYASLGYRDHCRIIEAIGHRRRFVGVIITSVCKRLGLVPKYREGMEPNGQLPSEGHFPGPMGSEGNRGCGT